MRTVYTPDQLHELADHKLLYGTVGPVDYRSPAADLLEAGLTGLEIDAPCIRIEVNPEALPECLEHMRELPFAGWMAAPAFESALCDSMDALGESAQTLKSVNTIIRDDNTWIGFNSFGEGWVRAIRQELCLDVRDLKVLIIGTDGMGLKLARQAASEGCERLVLTDPHSLESAQLLIKELRDRFVSEKLLGAHERLVAAPFLPEHLERELNATDLLVNGTPLGMKPTDPPVLNDRLLQPHLCVMDMLCRPTRFQDSARKAGARASNGLLTRLHEAAVTLELWTGRSAPLPAMRSALKS